ncbi:MAG TPA: TSUP family transporter [Acidimicrobiales bacterium]|nr:TSUP family transporter [Acidimicrobiales bacterium]
MTVLAILLVGAATGFLGGLFGKGGSALATPILAALGIPPIVALAGPLPATIPGTLLAGRQYAKRGLVDWRVTAWCVAVGLPATVVGALCTRWVPAASLVTATDVLVGGLGVGILIGAGRSRTRSRRDVGSLDDGSSAGPRVAPGGGAEAPGLGNGPGGEPAVVGRSGLAAAEGGAVAAAMRTPTRWAVDPAVVAAAAAVGLVAGFLANSGGFLLAPLFLVVLRLPVRTALGTSLVVSAALAVPGTVTHAALGHIDPGFVVLFGAASVPLSALGARTALRVDADRLEVAFGAALVVLAASLLAWG